MPQKPTPNISDTFTASYDAHGRRNDIDYDTDGTPSKTTTPSSKPMMLLVVTV